MRKLAGLLLVLPLVLCGCTITTYREGNISFTRMTLGANAKAQNVHVVVKPDGSKELVVGGYEQDQAASFGAAAQGVTTAIIHALPLP